MKKYVRPAVAGVLILSLLAGISWLCHRDYEKAERYKADAAARDQRLLEIKRDVLEQESRTYDLIAGHCKSLGSVAVRAAGGNKFDYYCVKSDAVLPHPKGEK